MTRSSVLLPDPFGPRIETSSPARRRGRRPAGRRGARPQAGTRASRHAARSPASPPARASSSGSVVARPTSCPSGLPSGAGGERRTRAERSARRTSERARGRRRPVRRRLVPSPIRTFTVGSLRGDPRHVADGSWAGGGPWDRHRPPVGGFPPTPKARLVSVLCADDTPCRRSS